MLRLCNSGVRSTLFTGTFLSYLSNLDKASWVYEGCTRVRVAISQFREGHLITSSFSPLNPSPF